MKKALVVTDDKGNIYVVPGQMSRKEAEEFFLNQPERSKREDSLTFQVPVGTKSHQFLQQAWDEVEEMRCSEQSGN